MVTRRKGEYVPLSLTYMDDDALLSCSPLAELLFIRMLAVAGQLKTDGYLTRAQILHRAGARLSERRVPALLAELVAAGPVRESDGGYRIRAWLEWNASAEELRRDRKRDAERKRLERAGQSPEDPDRPPGVRDLSSRTGADVQSDRGGSPNGLPPDSAGSPASRAPTRAGHCTVLNDTEPTDVPTPSASNARETSEGGRMSDLIDQVRAVRPFWSPAAVSGAARACAATGRTFDATLAAMLAVADDPQTIGPGRVTADGPWWRPPETRTARSTTDERVAATLALADRLEATARPLLRALPGGAR